MLFHEKTPNTVKKYHLVRAESPFTVKAIDWMHQTGPRKGACRLPIYCVLAKSVTVSVAV